MNRRRIHSALLRRRLEPETIAYHLLAGCSGIPSENNELIKAIKYGSGVTLSGLTCNISNATSYLFVSNPSSDLRKWIGFYITFTSSTGNTLKFKVSAAGTGETLDTSVLTNGGFDTDTTGWSAGASASLSSVAGGQSGNCLLVARNGANNPSANEVKTTILNGLYKAIAYAKQKEEATVSVGFKKMGLAQLTVFLLGKRPLIGQLANHIIFMELQ